MSRYSFLRALYAQEEEKGRTLQSFSPLLTGPVASCHLVRLFRYQVTPNRTRVQRRIMHPLTDYVIFLPLILPVFYLHFLLCPSPLGPTELLEILQEGTYRARVDGR